MNRSRRRWPSCSTIRRRCRHEALDQERPSSRYEPSPREFPSKLLLIEYFANFGKHLTSLNDGFRWAIKGVLFSHLLKRQDMGFKQVSDGIWDVYCGDARLGRMYKRILKVEDALGRGKGRTRL